MRVRLRLLVSVRFQVSFTPLVGVLFTFPSRYLCTIGLQGVFRLGGWSPHVQTGFHVPRPTQGFLEALRLRGYHPLRLTFPDHSASLPKTTGLFRVRSPLLAESLLMSFPPGTEMFQFPGFASCNLCIQCRIPIAGWVSPFGHPRINDRSHLPAAFRSVPRPSSPSGAKASTERPSHARSNQRPRTGPNRAPYTHATARALTLTIHDPSRKRSRTYFRNHYTPDPIHTEKEQPQPTIANVPRREQATTRQGNFCLVFLCVSRQSTM